jgi:hypothetical protein
MKIKMFLTGILLTLIFAPGAVFANDFSQMLDSREMVLGETHEPIFYVTTSRLNLRPSPDTDGTRLALVASGSRVEVLDFLCGEWFEVDYNGTRGFMFSEHLREAIAPVSVVPGTVEMLEWREARNIMTLGTVATIVDVRTGATWEVASFSNGNHADVEPISHEDTAIMRAAFGGSWDWTPRPVLVLINGRTLAASINGMPHGGSTRTNGMNGHICLHFLGSSTHRSAPSHVRDHQDAVREAYNTARTWSFAQLSDADAAFL